MNPHNQAMLHNKQLSWATIREFSLKDGYRYWYRQFRTWSVYHPFDRTEIECPGRGQASEAYLSRRASSQVRSERLLTLAQQSNLRWYLDPDRFRGWIVSQTASVGSTGSLCDCPIARYLSESLDVAVGVSDCTIEPMDEDDLAYTKMLTPSWAARFVREIDAWAGDVSKEGAIVALDKALEQTQWRKPNDFQRNGRADRN